MIISKITHRSCLSTHKDLRINYRKTPCADITHGHSSSDECALSSLDTQDIEFTQGRAFYFQMFIFV